MTLKSLYFNLTRENLKRRVWSIALSLLVFFFLFPVASALTAAVELNPANFAYGMDPQTALLMAREQLYNSFLDWHSAENSAMSFFMLCFSVVMASSGFSYLQSIKQTDFYHSLPISRTLLFSVVNVNSILITGISYLLMALLSAAITQIYSGYSGCFSAAMAGYIMHMAYFLLLYATMTVSVMLTGHLLVCLLGFSVLTFWGPAVITLSQWLHATWLNSYYDNSSLLLPAIQRSSPFLWTLDMTDTPAESRAAVALAAAVILLLLALLLYKRRKSESAGHAMAFHMTEAPIRCLIVIPAGIFGAMVAVTALRSDLFALFGLLCGAIITHCLIEIIYHFDFKRLFSHKLQLLFCTLASLAIIAVFRFDLMGYDSYLPKEDQVESVGVLSQTLEPNLYQYQNEIQLNGSGNDLYPVVVRNHNEEAIVTSMALTNAAPVLELAKQGIQYNLSLRDKRYTDPVYYKEDSLLPESGGPQDLHGEVLICWHLKNGRRVFRYYYMNLSAVRNSMDQVLEDENYKKAIYPVLSAAAADISGINYEDIDGCAHVPLSDESMKEQLLTSYQRELMALSADTQRHEDPIACIQFKSHEFQAMADAIRAKDADIDSFNRVQYYPVYPSFQETLSLLERCGVNLNPELSVDAIASITLEDNRSDETVVEYGPYDTPQEAADAEAPRAAATSEDEGLADSERNVRPKNLIVTDPEQIQEILDSAALWSLNCTNNLNSKFGAISIRIELKQESKALRPYGEALGYELSFRSRELPGFVKKYFHITSDDINSYGNNQY